MTNTVTFELPAVIKCSGARGITRDVDMTKATPELIAAAIDYTFGVLTQRASASIEDFDDKVKAENAKADEFAAWQWKPGHGGGGTRIVDLAGKAEVEMLTDLFMDQDVKKTEAEKRARKPDAREALVRLALSRAQNNPNVSDEEVAITLAEWTPALDADRDERKAIMEEEAAQAAKRAEKTKAGIGALIAKASA